MNDQNSKILSTTRYATISTVDKDNLPWAAPVWYVADDTLIVYWWSPLDSVHSQNIQLKPDVFITVFDSSVVEGEGLGLYIQAKAGEVSDSELDSIIDKYNSSTMVFKLDRDNCSGNAPTRLFKAVPQQIWVNKGKEVDGFYVDYRESIG